MVYYNGTPEQAGGSVFREGMPSISREHRERWLRPWLTGEQRHDDLLLDVSLDRLRKDELKSDLASPVLPQPLRERIQQRIDEHERAVMRTTAPRPQSAAPKPTGGAT